jgi:hypothetical protein
MTRLSERDRELFLAELHIAALSVSVRSEMDRRESCQSSYARAFSRGYRWKHVTG